VALVACAAPACQAAVPSSADVVTPGQALRLVRAAWAAALHASDPADRSLLASFSGQALDELQSLIQDRPAGVVDRLLRDMDRLSVYVPHQSSFPAQFGAYAHVDSSQGGEPDGELVILSSLAKPPPAPGRRSRSTSCPRASICRTSRWSAMVRVLESQARPAAAPTSRP